MIKKTTSTNPIIYFLSFSCRLSVQGLKGTLKDRVQERENSKSMSPCGSIKSETAVESSVQCNLLETKVSLIYKNINAFMTDIKKFKNNLNYILKFGICRIIGPDLLNCNKS